MTDAQAALCTALVIYGAVMTLSNLHLHIKVAALRTDLRRLLFEPGYYEKVQEQWRVFNAKCEVKEKEKENGM